MPRLLTLFAVLAHRDVNVLRAARFLSLLLVVFGVGWLFLLPLDQYNRHTYISENALLPGQVHTYFGGSEHEVFRAYRHEVNSIAAKNASEAAQEIEGIFQSQGLKTARQSYNFTFNGLTVAGENAYALIQGPRADATEAMVLMASLHNMEDKINYSGVALVLTMARYFNRWSLWSKDILLVITNDSTAGPEAWVSAYHELHDESAVEPLRLKAGAIQAAIALDYPASPAGHRFDKLHILYDGVNGALPNLDLINTVVTIANNQVGITSSIQGMHAHTDSYTDRLYTILRGIFSQGLGRVTGPHSAFMSYHIDAITLQTVGDGWHDEMSLGMVVESSFRSINNLLEKLHQSFFFYLLLDKERFVSIGTYLPSSILVAGSFSIISIALYLRSGKPTNDENPRPSDIVLRKANESSLQDPANHNERIETMEYFEHRGNVTAVPAAILQAEERSIGLPLAIVLMAHSVGLIPFYVFNNTDALGIVLSWAVLNMGGTITAILFAILISFRCSAPQQRLLIGSFSQLALGVSLATLSVLNFSLGLLVGLLAVPLNVILPITWLEWHVKGVYVKPLWKRLLRHLSIFTPIIITSSDALFLILCSLVWRYDENGTLLELLRGTAFAWHVHGTWTSVAIFMVWWPAWMLRLALLYVDYWLF